MLGWRERAHVSFDLSYLVLGLLKHPADDLVRFCVLLLHWP
jgi:hypothetical protein